MAQTSSPFLRGRAGALDRRGQLLEQQQGRANLARFSETSNLRSVGLGALEALNFTNPEQQDAFLQARISEIQTRGGDARDTIEALEMPFEERQLTLQGAVQLAERAGALQGGGGKQFADKSVFATREVQDPRDPTKTVIQQGFATKVAGGDVIFEPIGGTPLKLTPRETATLKVETAGQVKAEEFRVRQELEPALKESVASATERGRARVQIATGAEIKREEARGRAEGVTKAADEELLANLDSNLPGLKQVVGNLKELSGIATSTIAGRTFDAVTRELGFKVGKGANARAKLVAIIDNEILPQLKATFGGAFTEAEGNALRATFGDPNLSGPEKNASLDALIESKVRQAENLRRKVGVSSDLPSGVTEADIQETMRANGMTRAQVLQRLGVQ